MKTLLLEDGDLVIGAAGHETVSGSHKIVQDLRLALTERYGLDRFHPRWGSVLPNLIGYPAHEVSTFYVQQEVQRVISNYMTVQQLQVESDLLAGRKSRFSTADLVRSVDSIIVTEEGDTMKVRVKLLTFARSIVTFNTTLGQ